MRYTTAIFDLDGTLIDTINDLTDSVNFALKSFGFSERTKEEITSFVGNGVRRLVFLSVPETASDEIREKVLEAFKDYYMTHSLIKTRPYPGIQELVFSLKAHGVKTAVVTNKMQSAANDVIKHFFGESFDIIVGQVDGISQKPEPDGVFYAMEKLGSDKDKTVYIGDSDVDCATARNAGLPVIGAAWGFKGREFLENVGADYIVDSSEEIERIIIQGE